MLRWRMYGIQCNFIDQSLNTVSRSFSAKTVGHYDDVIMSAIASQMASLTIVYSIVYSGTGQRKHQSSASLAFVQGIHRGPVNSPHKGPVTRKMFPFDDVIMNSVLFKRNGNQHLIQCANLGWLCLQWPLLLTWFNISAWISNYMPGKVWDEITYPFLNFNGCTVEV